MTDYMSSGKLKSTHLHTLALHTIWSRPRPKTYAQTVCSHVQCDNSKQSGNWEVQHSCCWHKQV